MDGGLGIVVAPVCCSLAVDDVFMLFIAASVFPIISLFTWLVVLLRYPVEKNRRNGLAELC